MAHSFAFETGSNRSSGRLEKKSSDRGLAMPLVFQPHQRVQQNDRERKDLVFKDEGAAPLITFLTATSTRLLLMVYCVTAVRKVTLMLEAVTDGYLWWESP